MYRYLFYCTLNESLTSYLVLANIRRGLRQNIYLGAVYNRKREKENGMTLLFYKMVSSLVCTLLRFVSLMVAYGLLLTLVYGNNTTTTGGM